jgi:hypothetical protein
MDDNTAFVWMVGFLSLVAIVYFICSALKASYQDEDDDDPDA